MQKERKNDEQTGNKIEIKGRREGREKVGLKWEKRKVVRNTKYVNEISSNVNMSCQNYTIN
jgi:hypothetical protein